MLSAIVASLGSKKWEPRTVKSLNREFSIILFPYHSCMEILSKVASLMLLWSVCGGGDTRGPELGSGCPFILFPFPSFRSSQAQDGTCFIAMTTLDPLTARPQGNSSFSFLLTKPTKCTHCMALLNLFGFYFLSWSILWLLLGGIVLRKISEVMNYPKKPK